MSYLLRIEFRLQIVDLLFVSKFRCRNIGFRNHCCAFQSSVQTESERFAEKKEVKEEKSLKICCIVR